MNDAMCVSVADRLGDFLDNPGGSGWISESAAFELAESGALNKAHRVKMLAADRTNFVDRHNTRMLQLGGRLSLAAETLDFFVACKLTGKNHLQGNDAIKLPLSGAIDHTHSPAADFFQQLIIAET